MSETRPVITVFRSRLRDDSADDYQQWAARMLELARRQPGFLEFKSFSAPDGERLSIVVFDSPEAHDAWRDHPDHRRAQALGRSRFYAGYDVTVADVRRRRTFPAQQDDGGGAAPGSAEVTIVDTAAGS